MNFKSRYLLSIEEDGEDVKGTIPGYNIADEIEDQDANMKTQEIRAEIEADQAAVEEAVSVIEDLDKQVNNNEALLKRPETVTDDIVAMSQEAFITTIGRLHYSKDDVKTISIESNLNSVEKLRLSTEGIKEFIADLFRKIKDLIMSMINKIKMLYYSFNEDRLKKKIVELRSIANATLKSDIEISSEMINKYIPSYYSLCKNIDYLKLREVFSPDRIIEDVKQLATEFKTAVEKAGNKTEIKVKNDSLYKNILKKLRTQQFAINIKDSSILIYDIHKSYVRYMSLPNDLTDSEANIEFNTAFIQPSGNIPKMYAKSDVMSFYLNNLITGLKDVIAIKTKTLKQLEEIKSIISKLEDRSSNISNLQEAQLIRKISKIPTGVATKILPTVYVNHIRIIKTYLRFYNALVTTHTGTDRAVYITH